MCYRGIDFTFASMSFRLHFRTVLMVWYFFHLRWYLTLQGDNSLRSVERFDHMMFVCRFQASR